MSISENTENKSKGEIILGFGPSQSRAERDARAEASKIVASQSTVPSHDIYPHEARGHDRLGAAGYGGGQSNAIPPRAKDDLPSGFLGIQESWRPTTKTLRQAQEEPKLQQSAVDAGASITSKEKDLLDKLPLNHRKRIKARWKKSAYQLPR